MLTESGCSTVIRLGYSAIDFVIRPAKGIESFFVSETQKSPPKSDKMTVANKARQKSPLTSNKNNVDNKIKQKSQTKPSGLEAFFSSAKDSPTTITKRDCRDDNIADVAKEEIQSQDNIVGKQTLTDEEIARALQSSYDKELNSNNVIESFQPKQEIDRDQAMALKLQTKYDREHSVLSCVEKFSTNSKQKRKRISIEGGKDPKKSKIDSYFSCKK